MNRINNTHAQRQILTVSQLNRQTKNLLESNLPLIWIEGELSNFACPASGHWYFTLKDERAQVRCAMFKGRNQTVRLSSNKGTPKNGDQVLLRCRVSLYEGRGEFQLISEHMEEAGLGALQRRFDELKARLSAEGLFKQEIKQELPEPPKHIGVITSPTGAAVHDIITVLKRRFPSIPVTIYPTLVQGEAAANEISKAIQLANSRCDCDVLIVGRGGGSLEDLRPFNEEAVARAIYNSQIPIVSAVGHEVDFTIADFVADLRAPTPSAAAEILAPDGDELFTTFCGIENLLILTIERHIDQYEQKLNYLSKRLRHPGDKFREQAQRLDHLETRLQSILLRHCHSEQTKLHSLSERLSRVHPETKIQESQQKIETLHLRLQQSIHQQLNVKKQALGEIVGVMQAVSPLQTINRGYAVIQDKEGSVLRSSKTIRVGDKIKATLSDRQLLCSVNQITTEKDPLKLILDS